MFCHRLLAIQFVFTISTYHGLMIAGSISRFNSDLGLLEESVSRAGVALACCYSSAEEYEAEIIRVRRAAGAFDKHHMKRFRFALSATALVSLAALLVVLAF